MKLKNNSSRKKLIKKMRKWAIVATLVISGFPLFMHAKLYAKFCRGEAVAMSKECDIEIVVNGRRSKAPCYRLDVTGLPARTRHLHAFDFDATSKKTIVAPRDSELGGALFWLADSTVGVTQCTTLHDVSRLCSRCLLISETALNCTYDVQDDMKGLAAIVEIVRNATNRLYQCRFERAGKSVTVEFILPSAVLETDSVRLDSVEKTVVEGNGEVCRSINPLMVTSVGNLRKPILAEKPRSPPIRTFDFDNFGQSRESVPKGLRPDLEMAGYSSHTMSPFAFSTAQRASLVNQEMDLNLAAADLSSAYAEEMIATWRDRVNHEFVRNFAVQHLERYARECVVRGTWDPDSSDAADVRAALEEAVLETGTSVGGAALLALARLSEIDPHVDRTRLGARASSLVSDTSVPAANRASAAQVCGLLRVRSALSALRSLASDPATPTPLRLAADHAAKAIADR